MVTERIEIWEADWGCTFWEWARHCLCHALKRWFTPCIYGAVYSLCIPAARWYCYKPDQNYISENLAEMMLQVSVSYSLAYLYLERSENSICKWKTKCCCPCWRRVSMLIIRLPHVFDFSAKYTHFSDHQVKYGMTPPLLLGHCVWEHWTDHCSNFCILHQSRTIFRNAFVFWKRTRTLKKRGLGWRSG